MGAFRNRICVHQGRLRRRSFRNRRGYSFEYDRDYLRSGGASAVSLTLPLSEETYSSKTLFSFFDGLIPEGWLLGVITRNWKIDQKDRFGLLLISCRDAIGNVSIRGEKS